jgi:threonine dehydrogenase-like Zn-dependent dehydrogenase
VQALVTTPGRDGSTRVTEVPVPEPGPGEVLVRTLEVGVCGTDREISEGLFGVAPDGGADLVLGHELLGVVEADGHGFTRGDLVSATVRRGCGRCLACAEASPDSCLTGDYVERGITRLDGFARELVAEDADQLVAVPESLRTLGFLAEPGSVCARAIRHAQAVGGRQPWGARRALVVGTGAIGMLSACFLRLHGYDTWVAGRQASGAGKPHVVEGFGARYVSVGAQSLADVAAEAGGFSLVVEAAGDAQVMADSLGLLARNGVACLLGLDGRPQQVQLDGRIIGVDVVLHNLALVGSVNAHPQDWRRAVRLLDAARRRWPEALEEMVSLRAAPDDFATAFHHGGVKATLRFADA